MAYDLRPATTRARAAYVPGTTGYTLSVTSYSDGRDVSVQRDRGGVLLNVTPAQAGVEALSGGGVRITIQDASLWAAGDTLQVTRTSPVDDPSAYPRTGAASALSVRASMERIFALFQEILADAVGGEVPVSQVQLQNAVTAAIAARSPQFTAALLARLEGTMSRDQIANAIDAAFDDLPTAVQTNVTGDFVITLLDTAIGSRVWREPPVVSVSVDPNQMSGTGSTASPISIIQDGITVGLLAANAVQSRNIGDEQVTLDKLAAALQANWRNMLLSARSITVSAGTATVTRVDGSTYTFDVGTGGVGGNLEVFDVDPQLRPRSRGTFAQILFRDMDVTITGSPPNQRVELDPRFPEQQPADWDATSGVARIENKPEHLVRTFTDRPAETDPDTLYAYAGEPDDLGGQGLYLAYPNTDLPLNLVAAQFLAADTARPNALQAASRSLSNRYLRGFGMDVSNQSNPIYLWLDDSAPAAATLYGQVRASNGATPPVWSSWSAVLTFRTNNASPVPLVRPTGSRQYRAAPGVFQDNWQGGFGRDVQVRLFTDSAGTQPYALKRANLERWLEDPELAKSYLEHVDPDHRLSTHFLKDGAVARVVDSDPADLSGYVAGEMLVVLTAPPSLKVVTGGTTTPVPNANRMTVSTDGQGNAVSAQGDFDPNPGGRFYLFHAAAASVGQTGVVSLYLDPPGTPPALIIARPASAGFTELRFTRIAGAVGTAIVGGRTFYGYQASFSEQSDGHRYNDVTFSYDLYTEYVSASDNKALDIDTRSTYQPPVLSDIGAGGGAAVPQGGWSLTQVAPENREAGNITVDASAFTGELQTTDDTVQKALTRLDGGAIGQAVRIASLPSTAADDGGILSWRHATTTWVLRKLADSPLFAWTRSATQWTLGAAGKLAEIVNAFEGGSWAAVAGAAADAPYVATLPLSNPPVGVPSGVAFGVAVSNVSPGWGTAWIVLRFPTKLEYQHERYRLEVVDSGGTPIPGEVYDLDDLRALGAGRYRLLGTAEPYVYYAVQVPRIGAGEGYRLAVLKPFEPVRSRLDLVTRMLRDFVPDAMKTAANDRRVVVWSWPVRGFRLGNPERPTPVSVLPAQLVPGRRYITLVDLTFQPWLPVVVSSTGANTPQDTGQFGPGNAWRIFRPTGGVDSRILRQLVVRRNAGTEFRPIAVGIDGVRYTLGDTSYSPNDFIVQSAPADITGARRIVLYTDGDPHHNLPAQADYPSGDWTALDAQTLQATPGSAATWAQAGEPRPRLAEQVLQDGTGNGLSVTNSSASFNGSFEALQLNGADYDLDDSDKQLGVVFVTGVARLHSKSDTNISFDRTAVVNEIQFEGFTGLNDVRQEGVYSASDVEGVLIASIPVWLSGSTISTERYYLTRNGANVLGRFKRQEGSTGSSSWSVSFRELVVVVANDGTPAGSLTFTGLQQTPPTIKADEYYRGNSTGTALEQGPLPVASETVQGVVELATKAESDTGTDASKAMTPLRVKERIDAIPAQPRATGAVVGVTRLSTLAEAQGLSDFQTAISPLRLRQVLRGSVSEATETQQGTVEFASKAESDAGTSNERAMTPLRVQERIDAIPDVVDASDTTKGIVELAVAADGEQDSTRAVTPALLKARIDAIPSVADASATQKGVVELATGAETITGTDATRAVTPDGLADLTATEGRAGLVELATEDEADTGTDTERAVTPALLHRVVDAEINSHIHRGEARGAFSVPKGAFTPAATGADFTISVADADAYSSFSIAINTSGPGANTVTGTSRTNPIIVSWPTGTVASREGARLFTLSAFLNNTDAWVLVVASRRLEQRGRSRVTGGFLLEPAATGRNSAVLFARSYNAMQGIVYQNSMADWLGRATADAVGLIELASAAEATAGTNEVNAMTPKLVADLLPADASESVRGIVELANDAEADAGTDSERVMTPEQVKRRIDAIPRATGTQVGQTRLSTLAEAQGLSDATTAISPLRLRNVIRGGVGNATETQRGTLEIASSAEATTGSDNTKAITPLRLKERLDAVTGDASHTAKGLVELATNAETNTGTDATRAVTPAGLEAKLPHKVQVLTEAAYNALAVKDNDTLYFRTA